jgi:hypothetical protein
MMDCGSSVMRERMCALVVVASWGAFSAVAQYAGWVEQPVPGPSARQNHALAYDGRSLMLFGGYHAAYGHNNETWLWDGAAWTQADPVGPPQARSNHKMAYNSTSGKVVLFGGGLGGSDALNDTWEWDGAAGTWTQLFPAHKPAARFNHAMAYDAARSQIVLFGGYGPGGRYGDTWVFDGNDWTELAPAHSPTPRNGHAMTYDAARQVVVLFGGYPGYTNDTWEWDGTDWTQSPAEGPPGRQYLGLAYHSDHAVTIMSCGQMSGGVRAEDTWEYDGTSWTELAVAPPGIRDQHVLAYFPDRMHMVLHGGYAGGGEVLEDTWILTCCGGDLDGDGDTDHSDLGILLADWGCVGSEPGDCPGDVDGDFDTDHSDLGSLLADWGCGT